MAKFEKALKDLWSPHAVIFAPENDEKAASFLGVTTETKSLLSAARNSSIDAPQYTVQSQVVSVDRFVLFNDSDTPKFPLPITTAGILRVDPRLYGNVSFDESELGVTARAQGISFRPMEYIADADWFIRDKDDALVTDSYNKCLSITTIHYAQHYRDQDLQAASRYFSIQPGLLSIHWCKDKHNPHTVRIIAAWRREKNYKNLEALLTEKLSPHNDHSSTAREPEFTSFPMQEAPYWDDNTVVELITFDFLTPLSKAAKTAFEWYLNKFLATMQPSDPDEPSIAQPFGTLWSAGSTHQCLIAISWSGVPAREAWLRNFLAHPYDVAGYLVHGISLAGAVVKGKTGTLHTVDHFRLKYAKEEDEAADAGDEEDMYF
ncbi:hypothetical protein P171DRAFT_428764 [Karstenula rhodostoma CBS 690.94]|uniref:Uncharacterized protein n=1 Tax=Karstenula rhodostoma CBS 690.94 TaxID=1392251 RepID=A0A9P4PP61_9PLEO|nr:hypothetical protein P171DRAFT_428764 [Karstenula rhodostoma CBS 690.94]